MVIFSQSACGNDKLIVRSSIQFDLEELDERSRRHLATPLATADVVVCVSPKDAGVSRELFHAAPHARRYRQPTGSLPAEPTVVLAQDADGLASNANTLGRVQPQD